ncbi:5731_t:CDS:2 [Gigaspora rosea]|nr:5731_t:CDS:2 [Gigaspora rosea]
MEEDFKQFIFTLLEPIPQYVLGCLTTLAILGASPADKFTEKLAWSFRCLGCPFTGLFYFINIGSKKESRCMYWLSSAKFVTDKDDEDVKKKVEQCTATMSVLDRLSMLISSYFIVVGVLALISKTIGTIDCRGWPYIPTLLSWTILAIWRDAYSGIIVIKDPDKIFEEGEKDLMSFGQGFLHVWFTFCGFIVTVLLIVLGLFTQNDEWWVDVLEILVVLQA